MLPRHKILAVDDSPVNTAIITEILADDYRLETASTGEEALEIAARFRPALVLLDVKMPGIDGYEVCRRLRADKTLEHTKVIMVSAQSMVHERLEGYAAGADDYVTKPFDEDELRSKVRVFLRLGDVEEVDRLKTDMLALLSHEVNTPLNTVLQPAILLQTEEGMDTEKRRRLGEIVHASARRLHDFFEKVEALGKLKQGKRKLSLASIDLRKPVRSAIRRVEPRAAKAGVRIAASLEEATPAVADAREMERVAESILDNAVRFSPEGGTVEVAVSSEGDRALFEITDHGKGVDPDLLPRLFDGLVSGDIDRHSQGPALSLALAREVVSQHDGAIEVTSVPGEATTFTVRLPLAAEASAGAHALTISSEPAPVAGRTVFQGQIASRSELKRPLAEKLSGHVVETGLAGDGETRRLRTCFEEAIENAMVHGNRSDPELSVFVRLFYGEGEWGLVVEDQGAGIRESDLRAIEGGENAPEGSEPRGLAFIRQVMDRVEFHAGGRALLMAKSTRRI